MNQIIANCTKLFASSLLLALLWMPSISYSATITSDVTINKADSVKLSFVDDWLIGVFGATANINNIQYRWDYQCVYSSTGGYRIEVTSENAVSPRQLISSSGDSMAYTLYVYHRRGNGYRLRGYTAPVFNITNMTASTEIDCNDQAFGGNNLFFAALVRPADFNPAPPGIYRDTVTIVVTPE